MDRHNPMMTSFMNEVAEQNEELLKDNQLQQQFDKDIIMLDTLMANLTIKEMVFNGKK